MIRRLEKNQIRDNNYDDKLDSYTYPTNVSEKNQFMRKYTEILDGQMEPQN